MHEDAKVCYICGKYFLKKLFSDINYRKVTDHCHYTGKYRGPACSICNLKFHVPNEIPVVFYNGSKYDSHFIIKEFANEFASPFECIGENSEIYKHFFVPIRKEIIKINKDGKQSVETMSYKIKCIDSMRFMATSLTKLVDNLSKGIHEIKCADYNCSLKYENVKNNLMKYKCLSCDKKFSEKSLKRN